MNPKYQIFISSTYKDLKDEREQVLKSILRLGHIPIGMEMFNAANETQWEMIKRRIEESDYYVVIIARRYGTIEQESGLSYTEKEYDYANSIGVPTYGFVLEPNASWPGDRMDDEPEMQAALKRFIGKVQSKMRASWTNKDDLATAVTLSLNENITAFPRIGWVRADEVVRPETLNEMTRLSKENAELRERITQLQANVQNAAPMPDLSVALDIIEGVYGWYEHKQQDNDLFGLNFRQATVDLKNRTGLWLWLVVDNNGTLATDISVEINCSDPIVSTTDIDTFNQRNDGAIVPDTLRDGWHEATYSKNSKSWEFSGHKRGLRPGQYFDFIIPLENKIDLEAFQDTTITVNVFPVTGKHIKEVYRVEDMSVKPSSPD